LQLALWFLRRRFLCEMLMDGRKVMAIAHLAQNSQSQPNFAEMVLGWSPSKIMSGISDLRPRWPPQPNLI
jgi:hypothetical protein